MVKRSYTPSSGMQVQTYAGEIASFRCMKHTENVLTFRFRQGAGSGAAPMADFPLPAPAGGRASLATCSTAGRSA